MARCSPALPTLLAAEVNDRLPVLLTAIERHTTESFARANIRPMHGFENLGDVAVAETRALIGSLLGAGPA